MFKIDLKKTAVAVFLFISIIGLLDLSKGRENSQIIGIVLKMKKQDAASINSRYKKLQEDVKVFEIKGTPGIDEKNIFYPMYKTDFSPEELDRGLAGTGLEGLGKYFYEAEQKTGINSLLLVGIANHESNYGRSNIAKKKNNLFGFNAYDQSPMESASDYNHYGDSVLKVSRKIKDLYLTDNGRYFNGYSTEAMNKHYSTDKEWAKKVNRHMVRFAHKMMQNL